MFEAAGILKTAGQEYTIVEWHNQKPFNIEMFGLKATGGSTDCSAGWTASYEMLHGRLYLSDLAICTPPEDLPQICGIIPTGDPFGSA
jgi:hypothetical protein